MNGDWGVLGTVVSGLVALIIALGRGWLLLPSAVEQWQSRWEEMKDDRDFWRQKAYQEQDRAGRAIDFQCDTLEPNDDP